MPLNYSERKNRLPYGAASRVAEKVGRSPGLVTAVLKGAHRNRRIETALAKMMVPYTSVTEAFGPKGPEAMRRVRTEVAS